MDFRRFRGPGAGGSSLDVRRLRACLPALCFFAIAACGGGGSGDGGGVEPGGPPPTTVRSFAASVASSTAVPLPISPYLDNGVVAATWSISSSDPFHVDLYVSADAVLQSSSDIQVYSQNCGTAPLYACRSQSTVTCQFDASNQFTCSLPSSQPTMTNLTSFLNVLPKRSYLILHACNGAFTSCSDSAFLVEFQ